MLVQTAQKSLKAGPTTSVYSPSPYLSALSDVVEYLRKAPPFTDAPAASAAPGLTDMLSCQTSCSGSIENNRGLSASGRH
jgi:hypothetical protein